MKLFGFTSVVAVVSVVIGLAASAARAAPQTVCTITVNSPDEREVMRRNLPAEQYTFVELVEKGRPDWLASACRRQVRCDVLVVSGHFAGHEFYSSKFDVQESLPVDEMERVACSDSCPGLFSNLKEVYLFGCDTLKPEPVRSAMPAVVADLVAAGRPREEAARLARTLSEQHAESSRERMRRVFPGVPLIYGFSSLAPYGRVAGPMLQRYFDVAGTGSVGSGIASPELLRLFGPASMVATTGLRESEPPAAYRAEACRFHDDRLALADKVASAHALLGRERTEVRMAFERLERFFAALSAADREHAAVRGALAALAADASARTAFIVLARATEDPALRQRMIAFARGLGWLTAEQHREELVHLVGDVLMRGPDFGEVDLVCTLSRDHGLENREGRGQASIFRRAESRGPSPVSTAAALACLGDAGARERVLRAWASPDEREVQLAQAFLRHRPVEEAAELRVVAAAIVAMRPGPAQVRALETLARHRLGDREVLERVAALYARAASPAVQRAAAEVFLRSEPSALTGLALPQLLRKHRIPSREGGELIDTLLRQLEKRS